jgi:N-acetyl-anhydromuramyl-L-alanine amidase AmpD
MLKWILTLSLMFQQAPTVVTRLFRATTVRKTSDNIIVIHYDSGVTVNSTIKYLKKKRNSYHYIIDTSGKIYKLVDPKYEANHAGISFFRGHFSLNKYSIGICLTNDGQRPYSEKQYESLAWLITQLHTRYPDIEQRKIVGHSDIAFPFGRKNDPGPLFDWEKLFKLLIWEK